MIERPIVCYQVVSENLTGLGGRMGSERVWDNWRRFYSTAQKAKEAAELDYNRKRPETAIKWLAKGDGLESEDLGFVKYYVTPITVAD